MLPVATPSHPSSAPLPWHRDLDQALSWLSPCRRQEAPEQPHGLTSAHRKLHSNLSTTPWSTRAEHLQPLQQGKRMTATSVIPSRAEEPLLSLSSFPFLHMQLQRRALFGFASAAAAVLQRAPAKLHFRDGISTASSAARLPSEGEQRDAVAAAAFVLANKPGLLGRSSPAAVPELAGTPRSQPGRRVSGRCAIMPANLPVEFINSHSHSSISFPVHQG